MKQKHDYILVILSLLLTMSCNNDNSKILIDVHEVNYLNKTSDVIEGKLVKSDILGAEEIVVFDTLIMIKTKNPGGQLQVYSSNTLELLGSFCKQGRARNEMVKANVPTEQAYFKNGHIILVMIDTPNTFKEVDITASLQSGNTEVISSQECLHIAEGEFMILNNDYNYRYEFERSTNVNEDIKTIPTKYTVYKNGEKRELKFFNELMDVDPKLSKMVPYFGGLYKHPNKNLVVQGLTCMDYLIYMNFDADKYFAIHQKGSPTFNDTYVYNESQMSGYFTDGASSSKYLMFLYRHGKYTMTTTYGNFYPELLVFDWNGNYITGFKMDRDMRFIEYDEIHNVLYGLNNDEELYAYDMSKIIP